MASDRILQLTFVFVAAGYLLIQTWPESLSSLSPFENLEIIRGRTKRYVPCKDPSSFHKQCTKKTFLKNSFIPQKKSWVLFKAAIFFPFFLCSGIRSVAVAQLSITSLGLRSLKEISDGDVIIMKNPNLCYANKSHWKRLFKSEAQSATVEQNADATMCGESKLVSHTESSQNLLLFHFATCACLMQHRRHIQWMKTNFRFG